MSPPYAACADKLTSPLSDLVFVEFAVNDNMRSGEGGLLVYFLSCDMLHVRLRSWAKLMRDRLCVNWAAAQLKRGVHWSLSVRHMTAPVSALWHCMPAYIVRLMHTRHAHSRLQGPV